MLPAQNASQSFLEVFFVDIERASRLLDDTEASTPRLSPGDLARIATMSNDRERQARWRRARIAARIIIERAGDHLRQRDFLIGRHGRPELGNGAPQFSISHSGVAALVAISKEAVGADLEADRTLAMTDDRRRRITHAASRLTSGSRFAPDRDEDVLRAWVALEAYAKALGTGIGPLLTEEGILGDPTGSGDSAARRPLDVRYIALPLGYVAAIAAAHLPTMIAAEDFPCEPEGLDRLLARRCSPQGE